LAEPIFTSGSVRVADVQPTFKDENLPNARDNLNFKVIHKTGVHFDTSGIVVMVAVFCTRYSTVPPGDCGYVQTRFSSTSAHEANELTHLPRNRTSKEIIGSVGGKTSDRKKKKSSIKLRVVADVKKMPQLCPFSTQFKLDYFLSSNTLRTQVSFLHHVFRKIFK
jgi:hypothetical protein